MIGFIHAHLFWTFLVVVSLIIVGRTLIKGLGEALFGLMFLIVLSDLFGSSGGFFGGGRRRKKTPLIVTVAKLFTIGMVLFLLYYGLFMKH